MIASDMFCLGEGEVVEGFRGLGLRGLGVKGSEVSWL